MLTKRGAVSLVDVNMKFGEFSRFYLLGSIIGIVDLAGMIGCLVWSFWNTRLLFLVPIIFYATFPLVALHYVPFEFIGIRLVAFFYAALIYIMRFAMRFNPHLRSQQPKGVMLSVFKIYHQYVILSLAVIGLTVTTFIFGLEATIRDVLSPAWQDFPAIQWPIYTSHMIFIGSGIAGLALGFVREFHVKQEELLDRGFE